MALARSLAARGWRVGFLDGTRLFDVELPTRAWARSLALRDVTPWPALVADLAVVWLAQALPLPRLLLRRGDALDAVLLLARLGLVAGTAPAYARAGRPPLALAPGRRAGGARASPGRRCAGPDVAGSLVRPARAKRSPIRLMSAPVAAVRWGESRSTCATGKPKTPTLAPQVNDEVAVTAAHAAAATPAARGDSTTIPPTKVRTDRPPRNPAKAGQAWPTMAAPAAP